MALSETQLSGLKKQRPPITDNDIRRILPALGLHRLGQDESYAKYAMPIVDDWHAVVFATLLGNTGRANVWGLEFFVERGADGARLGTVHRFTDADHLQLKGAPTMGLLFESVDELEPYQCGQCETGLLTWDGREPGRTSNAGMTCGGCGWTGNTGAFVPFRRLT